jgi:four helix bundle protein
MMNDELKNKIAIDLKVRTRMFSLRVIKMYGTLKSDTTSQTIGKQVLRSATSVGAHYREGIRSRSDAEIISKWSGALQELEETAYWFELLIGAEIVPESKLAELVKECDELIAILTASVKTIKGRNHA